MENKEENRKIQFTGKSSYIVTLPKEWITEFGIKQGDQVRMKRNGLTMQIFPPNFRTHSTQTEDANFEISNEDDVKTIVRKLISLYFLGFKTINIKPKTGMINTAQRAAIKRATKRMLMGSEIISDSSSGITIQVLVNLLELSVIDAFKRMIHLAISMLSDAVLALNEENDDLAEEVIDTDDEVDRFGFYIIRHLKIAIQNDHMLKEMGFDNARNCLGYRLVVKNIERTGDHAVLIAKEIKEFKKPIKKEILNKIKDMNEFAISNLDDACLALFKGDYLQAENTIKKTGDIMKYEKKVQDATKLLKDDEQIYRIRRITENIRRISEYASDIAEIVLNMNIEKVLKKMNV